MINKLKQFLSYNKIEELTKKIQNLEDVTDQMQSKLLDQELQIKELVHANENLVLENEKLLSEKVIDNKLIDDLMRESTETSLHKKPKKR